MKITIYNGKEKHSRFTISNGNFSSSWTFEETSKNWWWKKSFLRPPAHRARSKSKCSRSTLLGCRYMYYAIWILLSNETNGKFGLNPHLPIKTALIMNSKPPGGESETCKSWLQMKFQILDPPTRDFKWVQNINIIMHCATLLFFASATFERCQMRGRF